MAASANWVSDLEQGFLPGGTYVPGNCMEIFYVPHPAPIPERVSKTFSDSQRGL